MIRRRPRSTLFPTRRSSDLTREFRCVARVIARDNLFRENSIERFGFATIGFFYGQLAKNADREARSEEHTSELQSHSDLVCRLLLEKKNHLRPRYRRQPLHH